MRPRLPRRARVWSRCALTTHGALTEALAGKVGVTVTAD
jgi:hypothetical protein